MKSIFESAEQLKPELVSIRRTLHQYPEVGPILPPVSYTHLPAMAVIVFRFKSHRYHTVIFRISKFPDSIQ